MLSAASNRRKNDLDIKYIYIYSTYYSLVISGNLFWLKCGCHNSLL